MASTSLYTGAWVSGGVTGPPLSPGQSHSWVYWGYTYGDGLSVTAHPVVSQTEAILQVENVQVEGDDAGGRRLYFTVRNVGSHFTRGYAISVVIVGP
jgi:hypothetical protein